MWKNTPQGYGLLARWLHWGMAVLILGLCGLGFYITTLTYYHPWYRIAPDWHRSLGVLAFLLVCLRLAWRIYSPPPPLEVAMASWEKLAAHGAHLMLYLLMFTMPVAGYLLSTADGRGVDVFGWFTLPAFFPPSKGMETLAGKIHLILGIVLLVLVTMHAMAALKHHFIHGDNTLRRMLTGSTQNPSPFS